MDKIQAAVQLLESNGWTVLPPATPQPLTKDSSVVELEMTVRVTKALEAVGITTVGQLLDQTIRSLEKKQDIGRKAIFEIDEALWKKFQVRLKLN